MDMNNQGFIEPTPDEAKNGWTPERLTQYIKEREGHQAAHAGVIEYAYRSWGERLDPNRPTNTDSTYDPMRW